jgi:hypothetical protein
MKNIVFCYILLLIFVHSIALRILQDGPDFTSVETVLKLVKNEINLINVPSNSTRFHRVLEKIKRELDEVSKSRKGRQVLVTKFSKTPEEDVVGEKATSRFLASRTKRSSSKNEKGFSDEIMQMIEGLVTVIIISIHLPPNLHAKFLQSL